jgi:hypothetical protein
VTQQRPCACFGERPCHRWAGAVSHCPGYSPTQDASTTNTPGTAPVISSSWWKSFRGWLPLSVTEARWQRPSEPDGARAGAVSATSLGLDTRLRTAQGRNRSGDLGEMPIQVPLRDLKREVKFHMHSASLGRKASPAVASLKCWSRVAASKHF